MKGQGVEKICNYQTWFLLLEFQHICISYIILKMALCHCNYNIFMTPFLTLITAIGPFHISQLKLAIIIGRKRIIELN